MSMTPNKETAGSSRPRRALALACVPAFMVGLDALVVTIALATIRRDLHASVAQLGWTVNAYVLSFGVLILLGAVLGDRLGRRRMFTAGLGIFTAASAVCALAPSPEVLIIARAVQGAGAALISPLSLALVSAAFPPGQRGKAIGIWGAITGSAVAVGPVIGGAIVQGISWHWIFWINVPIGLAAAILSPRMFEESFGPRRTIDAPGVLLASAGLLALVWAIIRGNATGWTSPEILATLLAGTTLLVVCGIRQTRTASPMLPRHLFADRSFVAANAATFLLTAALFGAAFLIPQYLQSGLHHSALTTGVMLLPWTGVTMLITPLAGALADRIGNRPLMISGLLLQAIAFAWIGAQATPTIDYAALIAPLLLAGIGISLVFGTVTNAVLGGVTAEDHRIASATNATFRQLGAPFGVAIASAVFTYAGAFATPDAIAAGVRPALIVAGAISALGAATALRVRAHPTASLATPAPATAS
jgi:EmrB/QacA subfamily drug resistance transporter